MSRSCSLVLVNVAVIYWQSSYQVTASFADRFLQTAEMLKPSTPSASHDSTGSSGGDDGAEYYPHIGDLTRIKTHHGGLVRHT